MAIVAEETAEAPAIPSHPEDVPNGGNDGLSSAPPSCGSNATPLAPQAEAASVRARVGSARHHLTLFPGTLPALDRSDRLVGRLHEAE